MTFSATTLCLALMMTFTGSVICEDFCRAFKDNGNKIDYLYHRDISLDVNPDSKGHHIIINRTFWRFHFFYEEPPRVEFNSSLSGSAPFFTNEYLGAACVPDNYHRGCITLLFDRTNLIRQVDWLYIRNDDFKQVPDLSQFGKGRTKSRVLGVDKLTIDPMHVKFVTRGQSTNPNRNNPNSISIVDFVGTTNPNSDLQIWRIEFYYGFSFYDTEISDRTDEVVNGNGVDKPFKPIDKKAIAVANQYGPKKYPNGSFGFLILTEDNLVIKWCYRLYDQSNCHTSEQLVHCEPNPTLPRTTSTTTSTTTTSTSTNSLIFVVFLFYKRNADDNTKSPISSRSPPRVESKDSSTSSPTPPNLYSFPEQEININ